MIRRQHSVQTCSCPACTEKRNCDDVKTSQPPGRGARHMHRSRPRPLQLRKRSLLIDKFDSPPGEIIPVDQRVRSPPSVNYFPVPCDSNLVASIQYYFEVFALGIHPGKEDSPDAWKDPRERQSKLQAAMADPMWFCANVAFAEAMKDQTLHDARGKSDVIVKYQSRALADLRRRLVADKDTDILLWTITILMSLDISFADFDSWKAHTDGLERIVNMRGGLESLNNNTYLKTKIIGFNMFWNNKQLAIATSQTSSAYPTHPFPPHICVAVSKLPQELSDLALDGCFNTALIELMADAASLSAKLTGSHDKRAEDLRRLKLLGYELEELFRIGTLSQLEKLVIAALVDYCVSVDSDRNLHWLLMGALRMRISYMWCKGITYVKKYAKAFIWAGALLSACSEPSSLTFRLGSNVLSLCSEHHVLDKAFVLTTCRRFLWDDFLTDKLEQKFDFDCTPSDRTSSVSISPTPATMIPYDENVK